MHKNLSLGLELDADDLAAEVRKDYTSLVGSTLKDATVEQLMAFLSPEQLKQLRLHDLKKLQEKQSGFYKQTSKSTSNSQGSEERKYMTPEQWKEDLAKRFGR